MRWIYISPHFDDAVLSCGGLIYEQARQGLPVEIWTIFAGDPPGPLSVFALKIHALWGTGDGPETIALRKTEDENAAACVGADVVRFDFADCIYRIAPDGSYLYPESVFVPAHALDQDLPEWIASAVASELLPEDVLVCPLALGGHIDHVLARQAIESLHRPRLYYADIPYIFNYPNSLDPAIAAMRSDSFDVSEAGLKAWLEGVESYASQISSLYKGEGTLYDAIRAYCENRHGTLLWRAG
jgi:LmbE family N-acetylglucosaminyl deacetylase